MRCLLKPARIQLSTICRGFGPWTDCMLRAAFFIASTPLMLPTGIGSSRWSPMPSADRLPSPGSERKRIPTLNLFQNQQLGLFCGPLGSIFCDTRNARHIVPWPGGSSWHQGPIRASVAGVSLVVGKVMSLSHNRISQSIVVIRKAACMSQGSTVRLRSRMNSGTVCRGRKTL